MAQGLEGLDYHGSMKRLLRPAAGGLASLALLLALSPGQAQTDAAPLASARTADLFYEVLLGELNAASGERGPGYALILDAAIKSRDPQLFRRAIELALQVRSPDAALRAARAWREALPDSREGNRYLLQLLVASNRLQDSAGPLRDEIASSPPAERSAAILAVPGVYARVADKALARNVVEQALAPFLDDPATSVAAWASVGRMRQLAGDADGALQAAERGLERDPVALPPAILALELFSRERPQAEAIVKRLMANNPSPDLQLAYARALLGDSRYAEATAQLEQLTSRAPEFADAWLVLGTLQAQEGRADQAHEALQRFLVLAEALPASEPRQRAMNQAYLSLAQAAEKRNDVAAAQGWLDRIVDADNVPAVQLRRAALLARQGRLDEARKLVQALPERGPDDARMKFSAEVQLLRDAGAYQQAYDLIQAMRERLPEDVDLMYEQAMMAERLERLSEMERLLRRIIELRPDYHHAYNALGYSLADRNVRLPEAKRLIEKALEFAPSDPFITDSLGWVEFRLGNRAAALQALQRAYEARPDAEIAAHYGEVLWVSGQRERAQQIWREGLALNPNNDSLRSTIKRLRVPGL